MITVPGTAEDMPQEQSPVMRALSSDSTPAEPQPAEEASPVAKLLLDDSADTARLQVAHEASAATTPDQAARVLKLEMTTGLPSDFIAQDVDGIEKMAADRSFSAEEFRKSNPKFSGWLAANPQHYAFAKDDLGFFGRIEKAHQAFSDGVASVPVQEELAGLINQEMDGSLPAGGSKRIADLDKILQDQQARGEGDDKIAYGARQMGYSGRQFVSTFVAGAQGAAPGAIAGSIYGSAVPGLGTVAGYTAGAAAGVLSASWLYSYRMERAFAYKDLKSIVDIDGKPMDPNTLRTVATGVGILNAFIEVGSEVMLAKLVPGLNGLLSMGKQGVTQQVKAALIKPTIRGAMISGLSKLATAGATEGLEEIAQAYVGATGREVSQGLAAEQSFAPDSGMKDAKDALSQGTAAFVGTALTFGPFVGGAHFITEVRAARTAERAQNFAMALGEGVESKAFKNLPEKAQDAVRAIVKGGQLKTAFIDVPAWQQYWQKQGVDPREVAAEILGSPKAYDEALSAGHEIAVPMENYARKIAVVPEANAFFAQEIRHEPGAMNGRESRELFQKIEQEGVQFMSAEDEFKAQTTQDSSAAIKAKVLKQLKDAGVDDKTARTQTELLSGFTALGERAGVDPLELFNRYQLKIRNADQLAAEQQAPAQETFMQRVKARFVKMLPGQEKMVSPRAVTWEAIPSKSLGSSIVNAPAAERAAFTARALRLITDMRGNDKLAAVLGFGQADTAPSTGAYEGGINPNVVTGLPAEAPIEDVRRYARALQYIYRQDAVPFFQVRDAGATPGIRLTFASAITPEEEEAFFAGLRGALTESAGYTKLSPNTIAILDFEGNPDFESKVMAFAETNERITAAESFRAESEYGPVHDWKSDSQGSALAAQAVGEGRPALQSWLDSRRAAYDQLLEDSGHPLAGRTSYAPMSGLTQTQRDVETRLAETLGDPSAAEKYAALPGTLGGKLLNVDEARLLADEYAADKAGHTLHTLSTQRPSSAWIEQRFADLLAEPAEGAVLFMAGGGGSGKTTVLNAMLAEQAADADVLFDSVFAHLDKAIARVEAALKSGRDVTIAYVHRDAFEAARDGVAGRFEITGRWVPAGVLAEDHVKAQQTILELAVRYKDDERVSIAVFENRTGQDPREMTLDELRSLSYTANEETAVEAAQRLLPGITEALRYVEQKAEQAKQESDQSRGDASQGQTADASRAPGSDEGLGAGSEDGPASDELTLQQSADDGARARIRIGANRTISIDLFKQANASSLVHELWHFYFEVLADLSDELSRLDPAKRTRGQQGIIDDYATLLRHVGAADRAGVNEAMHEQIARMGEAYLMKGNAPSIELRRTFARFKVWLTHVYRNIKALAVDLKPEVVKVFDRILATEEEISRAETEQNVTPLFDDPKALLGEKAGEKYLNDVADARNEAEEELSAKVLGEVKREQEAWWKEERAKVFAEMAAEVNAQPIYKALAALQNHDPDSPQIKLDRAAIDAMWTLREDAKKNLPRGITSKDSGLHPSIVAEMFGFKSALEFLDALASAEDRRALIEKLTDARMVDLHGDITQETGRMHEEALSAIHNKKRSAVLHRELEILTEKYMPSFKGLAFKIARRPPTQAAIRSMAEGMIGSKVLKDINPVVYQRAEAKAGREAVESMLKGDFDTVFAAKYRELLNHELFRAAVAAREDIDKALERFKKMARKDADLAKTRDIDLVNAARAVLASFGIGKMPKENAVSYLEQMARYDPDMHATVQALVAQSAGTGSYEASTYNDFVYLKDSVDALWDLSRRTKQVMVDGVLMDRDQVMAELANRIGDIGEGGKRAGYDRALTTWDKAKIGMMGIRAALRRIESWVSAMDGGDRNGVFRKYIWTPISEATAAYRVDRRTYLERYLEIVKGVEKSLTHKEIAARELGYTFTDKAELLGALLHSGNESNLSKLLRGRGWGSLIETDAGPVLDRSKWDAFIARAQSEGILTKSDYDYAQAVWSLLEELKPRAQKIHKEMYGFYFSEISAKEIETPWGKYKGGYVPAVADTFMAADAAIRQEREQMENGNNSFMFPTAGRGFTKGRVERYAAPLMMDVRFIPGHIDKVLRFIHIEPRVKDIARIVMDRGFRKTLDSFDQTVGGDMLIPWLQRSAQQRIDTPSNGYGGRAADTFFRALRSRVGLNVMFANVANTLQQPFDLSRSFAKVEPRYMRSALWAFMRNPGQMAENIAAMSEFMSTRETTKVMEIQRTIDDMMLNPTKYEEARKFAAQHGYFMQGAMQNIVDTVTWTAAYDKATAEGESQKGAVRFADSVVRETQGSMSAEDVSRFETGTPFERAFTMFYGYFNMQANLLGTEFLNAYREMGLKKGAGRMLYVYTFAFMIPALMGDAVVKAMSGDKWDQDDDGYLDDIIVFFFAAQARNVTALFPFVGPTVLAGVNAWNSKWYDDRISTSPAISAIESSVSAPHSIYQALHDKTKAKKAIRDTMTLIGLASGLPVAPLAKPLGYLADVSSGKARPKGIVDYTRGLLSGKVGK